MGLEGSHVKVCDEVHNSHCPCYKGDLVLLVTQELDHLKHRAHLKKRQTTILY